MKYFFYSLPQSIIKSFSGRVIFLHILAIIATYFIVVTGLDWQYFLSVRNDLLNQIFFPALIVGGLLPIILPVCLVTLGYMRRNVKYRIVGFAIAQAALIGSIVSSMYKAFTGRVQPDVHNLLIDSSTNWNFGFLEHGIFWGWPSSHTTIAFAVSVTILYLFPRHAFLKYFVLLYAFYVGFGVSLRIHWFSEFVAGALIGTAIGITVGRLFGRKMKEGK